MREGRVGSIVVLLFLSILITSTGVSIKAEEEYHIAAILQSPEPKSLAKFGYSLAVSEDLIVVGEHLAKVEGYASAGKAYIFDLDGNLKATLHSPIPQRTGQFGWWVAISGDIVVIGEIFAEVEGKFYAGKAHIFDSEGNLQATLQSPEPLSVGCFGINVVIIEEAVLVSDISYLEETPRAGKVYIFDLDGNLKTTLQSPDPYSFDWANFESSDPYYDSWGYDGNFGFSTDGSGDIIVVGEPFTLVEDKIGAGKAFIFDSDGNLLKTLQSPEPQELSGFGYRVAVKEDIVVVSEYYAEVEGHIRAGKAYIFDLDGNLLAALQSPEPEENALFGTSVATNGENVIVGVPLGDVVDINEGNAYVFDLDGNLLATLQSVEPKEDAEFGYPVRVEGDIIVVGEYLADLDEVSRAGRVYVFRKGMASFEMSGLSVNPSSVNVGGSVTISVECSNEGSMSGSHTVTLKIDGEVEDEKTVTVAPNESTTISFDAPTSEKGTYSVEIEGLTGSYEVKGGIPGFPVESMIIGLAVAILVLWFRQRTS
jgi:plastocyanin